MNEKNYLPQKIKDYFDIIRAFGGSYLAIVIIGYGLIVFAIKGLGLTSYFNPIFLLVIKYVSLVVGAFLILSPLIIHLFYNRLSRFLLKQKKFLNTDIIIEKQKTVIDICDLDGKRANYFEKITFNKVGHKNKKHYLTTLKVSGIINTSSISTFNCYYSLNHEKNKITISYVNKSRNLNNHSSLIKSNDKTLSFYSSLEDTFLSDSDSWGLYPINYCMDYKLKIMFPNGRLIKTAKLFRKGDNEEFINEIEDLAPMIINWENRQCLVLQIINYDYAEELLLKWELYPRATT